MAAKTKKQSKNRNQPGLRTAKNTFVQRNKLLVVAIVFILGGTIGVAVQRRSMANTEICKDELGKTVPCRRGCEPYRPNLGSTHEANLVHAACSNPPRNNPGLYSAVPCTVPKLDIFMKFDVSGSMFY